MDNFNMVERYKFYLERVKLVEEQLHPIQRKELKQAFMAGMTDMLIIFTEYLSALPEDEAGMKIENMMEQAATYFAGMIAMDKREE